MGPEKNKVHPVTSSKENLSTKKSVTLDPKILALPQNDSPPHQSTQKLLASLYGRPVQEVDPFVFDDTFCIVSKKYGKDYIFRFSATRSLFIFGPLNPIRKIAAKIITNQLFDFFIILVILCNCVTLALVRNYEIGTSGDMLKDPKWDYIVERLEDVYLGIYTLEMVLKIIAKGFFVNKFSYLRNRWNILDFVVVMSGYITIIVTAVQKDTGNKKNFDLDLFRTFRVLRAVKTISILPGLRMMINTILSSIPPLLEVMALTLFCLMIFALLALELYQGKLRHKCVLIKNSAWHKKMVATGERQENELVSIDPNDPYVHCLWYDWVHDERNWRNRENEYPMLEYMPCANDSWGRSCGPDGFVCLPNLGDNYDEGWTSFDNFHSSMLSTFQLVTLDFWERLYELILSTTNPAHVFFFLIVIFLGSFYLLNLMLAVVAVSYDAEDNKLKINKSQTKNQKLSVYRKASNFSFEEPQKLYVTPLLTYVKRTAAERELIARNLRKSSIKEEKNSAMFPMVRGRETLPDVSAHNSKKSQLFYSMEGEGEDDGKKKPNFQTAIMTLLGRRASFESKKVEKKNSTDSEFLAPVTSPVEEPPPPETADASISAVTENDPSIKTEEKETKSIATTQLSQATKRTKRRRCLKCLKIVRIKMAPFVNHWTFESTITASIIINTILMSSEHNLQPKWLDKVLLHGNYLFTAIFTTEAVIKICALQRGYFKSGWNIFDLFIIILSLVDVVQDTYDLRISVIRAFRLLRVFKLAQSWITMKVLLNIIMSTFGQLLNLILVLLIVLYIFAVLGLQYLGEYYTRSAFDAEEDERQFPRWNFQNFWYAFMMVFRVLCGEWIEPLWDCLKALKQVGAEYKCFVIFLPILVVCNFIVLNLFLALLLNSFDTEELEMEQAKEMEAKGKTNNFHQLVNSLLTKKPTDKKEGATSLDESGSVHSSSNASTPNKAAHGDSKGSGVVKKETVKTKFQRGVKRVIMQNRRAVAEKMIEKAALKQKQTTATVKHFYGRKSTQRHSSFGFGTTDSTSMTLDFGKKRPDPCIPRKCSALNCACLKCIRSGPYLRWDRVREVCNRVVSQQVFEYFILGLIFASSATLCVDDNYLDKHAKVKEGLFYLNIAFTIIFTLEMILKWFAHGMWTYFTTAWTILDFIIVAISITLLSIEVDENFGDGENNNPDFIKNLAALKALRTLRALRPLRVISRWQGMKIVINALMYAIPSIVNVLLVCLLFWLIFSIMGVQFFKGKFYKCVDNEEGDTLPYEVVQTKAQCCNNTEKWSWINQAPNFDSVFQGYLILFQVATFEGWIEAMRAAVDSTDVDYQPKRDSSMIYYIYFVIFIVFGAFFTLNLFIGVIIDNFNRLKKKYEGNLLEALLTPSQKHYYKVMKQLGKKKPRKVIKRPSHRFASLFYDLAMSRRFEIAIFGMIFLNMVTIAFDHHNQRQIYTHILSALNLFFITIYSIEAIIKIIGLRQNYFTVPWNLFDFGLVVASLIDLGVGDSSRHKLPIEPTMLRIVRVFRIGRVLRLIKAAKGIRKLLFALIVSLPALFNIGALLSLITFIYAILGMALFGKIPKGGAVDEIFNFDTFLRSCLFLLRIMTAAGWNDVLSAMTVEEPVCGTYRKIKCGAQGEGECANVTFAIAYMVSYLMISYLIVINMYIAIILENFVDANREEEVGIVDDDLETFYVRWSRYDPQATQFISFGLLSEFLASLNPPLQLKKPNIVAVVAFNLPIARGNKIHCVDILHALVKHVLGHIEKTDEFDQLQEQMEHKFRKQFPTRKLLDIISSTRTWKVQHNAAIIIQRAWRAYRARKYPVVKAKSSIKTLSHKSRSHRHDVHHTTVVNKNLLILGHHYHESRRKSRETAMEAKARPYQSFPNNSKGKIIDKKQN